MSVQYRLHDTLCFNCLGHVSVELLEFLEGKITLAKEHLIHVLGDS